MKNFYPNATKMSATFAHEILYCCACETVLQTREGAM